MATITFRNSKIVYYGPHGCDNCGESIVKMGTEWGGTAFLNPSGPIYPNTEWHPHVCDPAAFRKLKGQIASERVCTAYPLANAVEVRELGFVIFGEPPIPNPHSSYLVVSPSHTFYETESGAWTDALRRQMEGLPSWHILMTQYVGKAAFGNGLDSLPQCPA